MTAFLGVVEHRVVLSWGSTSDLDLWVDAKFDVQPSWALQAVQPTSAGGLTLVRRNTVIVAFNLMLTILTVQSDPRQLNSQG